MRNFTYPRANISHMNSTKRILTELAGDLGDKAKAVAGKINEHRNIAAGTGAVLASGVAARKAFGLGDDLYSVGRRAFGVKGMVDDAEGDSEDAKHRRRILSNAQRKIENSISNATVM